MAKQMTSVLPGARLHEHVIDGWVVETTLSLADLVAMGPERALAALRRVRAAGGVVRRATEQEEAA